MNIFFFFFLQKLGTLPIAIPIVLFRERDRFSLFDMGLDECHKYMQYMTHTCNWILRKLHPGRVKQKPNHILHVLCSFVSYLQINHVILFCVYYVVLLAIQL